MLGSLNIYLILMWIITPITGVFGLIIYLRSKKVSSKIFAINIFMVFLWSVLISFIPITKDMFTENIILKLTFYLGSLITTGFYIFGKFFPDDKYIKVDMITKILVFSQIIFLPLYLNTDLIIGQSYKIDGLWGWAQNYGPLWFIFDIYFVALVILTIFNLTKKLKLFNDKERQNVKYMIVAIGIGFVIPAITSILLPQIGYFDLNWLSPISSSLWIIILAYSINKNRMFGMKILNIELVVFALWISIIFEIVTNKKMTDPLMNIFVLVMAIVLGLLLIRNSFDNLKQQTLIAELKGGSDVEKKRVGEGDD